MGNQIECYLAFKLTNMKNSLVALIFLLFACSNPKVQEEDKQEVEVPAVQDSLPESAIDEENMVVETHADEDPATAALISNYLAKNQDRFSSAGSEQNLAYMTDRMERDGKNYLTVQIGMDDEFRFATMQWLYIDTTTKQIYELDIVEDKLVPWP